MPQPARIVVKAPHLWQFDHAAELGPLDPPEIRGIARQGEVTAGRVVVLEVSPEDPAKVDLVQYDDVIEAFSAERADEPLRVRILPRGSRRRDYVLDSQYLDCAPVALSVDLVPISDQESWRALLGEGVDHLPSRPFGGRVRRHVEVQYAPPVMREQDKPEQGAERSGWHDEEVQRDQVLEVVVQERPPRRRGRPPRCRAWPVRCGCAELPMSRSPATSCGSGSRISRSSLRRPGRFRL
jgi:hypothetical protein